MSSGRGGDTGNGVVVVPRMPGPLIRPDAGTAGGHRDDLDDLIDELLPDTAEGPGPLDAALLAGGTALVGWAAIGTPPAAAAVAGAVAIGLGSILPIRSAWRALTGRRRAAVLAGGLPLQTLDPSVVRLVAAYDALDGVESTPGSARAAAHGAVLEVATLLEGRTPLSERERNYVDVRATAVQDLVWALRESDAGGADGLPGDLVVEAREELDALGGVSALSRLDDVTEEVRARGRRD